MADKNGAGKNEPGGRAAIGATAIKPDTKEGFAGFLEFLYNKKTGEVLGRSAKSWAQITLFYIVYYSFLTAFFALMLLAFFQTLDDKQPTWTMESKGLIGSNPAMGFRPGPPDSNIESTLIWFR